jgi:hypothetical protein
MKINTQPIDCILRHRIFLRVLDRFVGRDQVAAATATQQTDIAMTLAYKPNYR